MTTIKQCKTVPQRKYKERREIVFEDFEKHLLQFKEEFLFKFSEEQQNVAEKVDFDFLSVFTKGTIAISALTTHKKIGKRFTVNIYHKEEIVTKKRIKELKNYKQIVQSIRFPFVLHMEYWFQDIKNIYFVFPYTSHVDLFLLLQKIQNLHEKDAIFYGAQILLALEYLQSLDIVHRNIKPESILFDINGYLKLCNFEYAKICPQRTYSFCGTLEYISPEYILHKGYGKWVDFWSYGVLLYEMIAGYTPFFSSEEMQMFENIVTGNIHFGKCFSTDAKDLISHILQPDISLRYGYLKQGIYDIKCHDWFEIVDWQSLYNKTIHPPYHPDKDIPLIINPVEKDIISDKNAEQKYEEEFADF